MKKQDCKSTCFAPDLHPEIRENRVKYAGVLSEYLRSIKTSLWINSDLCTGGVDNMLTKLWINKFTKYTKKTPFAKEYTEAKYRMI